MSETNLNPVESKALDIYIDWGNSFEDDKELQVKREQFFSEHWVETYHIADLPALDHRLYMMAAGTGDEGGPCILYVWGGMDNDGPYISYIVQEFDTLFSVVYNAEDTHSKKA